MIFPSHHAKKWMCKQHTFFKQVASSLQEVTFAGTANGNLKAVFRHEFKCLVWQQQMPLVGMLTLLPPPPSFCTEYKQSSLWFWKPWISNNVWMQASGQITKWGLEWWFKGRKQTPISLGANLDITAKKTLIMCFSKAGSAHHCHLAVVTEYGHNYYTTSVWYFNRGKTDLYPTGFII